MLNTPKKSPSDVDPEEIRTLLLSYKYEVDCFVGDYQKLQAEYEDLAAQLKKAVVQHNAQVSWVRNSRMWRFLRKIAVVSNKLLGRGTYVDRLVELPAPKVAGASRARHIPSLPEIPALGYDGSRPIAHKTWSNTSFLSFHYYNQIEKILARQPKGRRKIFIQSPIIDWFVPLYQRPQHMALAMARRGYLVFYMTANTLGDRAAGFHEVEPNVFITNQPVHMMVDDALISFYSTVATMLAWQGPTMDRVRGRGNKVLYEYIDHIDPEISFHTTGALAKQYALVDDEHVDLVLASATALIEEVSDNVSKTPVVYVPNGVDVDHYDVVRGDRRSTVPPVMREVKAAGRPVVGYFGALAPWLWYPMLNELARRRTDLSFVYLGPDYLGASKELEALPNVYRLGAIDYSVLPYHAQHFDVAIIPFKSGDIAKTTSPLKLFEYFALEKPVVVTKGMLECEKYDEVLTAGSVDEFSRQIDRALTLAGDPGHTKRCRRLAESNNWAMRARVLAEGHRNILENNKSGVA